MLFLLIGANGNDKMLKGLMTREGALWRRTLWEIRLQDKPEVDFRSGGEVGRGFHESLSVLGHHHQNVVQ